MDIQLEGHFGNLKPRRHVACVTAQRLGAEAVGGPGLQGPGTAQNRAGYREMG